MGDRTAKSTLQSWLIRAGLVAPEQHRQTVAIFRQSKQLCSLAQQVSLSSRNPVDGAPLARKSAYLLLAAALRLNGKQATSIAECREQIGELTGGEKLFGPLLEELPFLDELQDSFAPAGPVSDEQAERYNAALKQLPSAQKNVGRLLNAKLRAAGSNPILGRGIIAAALVGAVAVAAAVALSSNEDAPAKRGPESPLFEPDQASTASPAPPPPEPAVPEDPNSCFVGTYFADRDFKESVGTRRDCKLDFSWNGAAEVGIEGLSDSGFSVRWEAVLRVPAPGMYQFHLASDDGSRMFVRDKQVIDNWGEHGTQEVASPPLKLREGEIVPLRVEFFDAGGLAEVRLLWSSATIQRTPIPGRYLWRSEKDVPDDLPSVDKEPDEVLQDESKCFRASYFKGKKFDELVKSRRDCRIDFLWGGDSVAGIEGLPADGFSVRWEGTLQVPETAAYVFTLGSDDGSRLFINDELLVGDWNERGYSDMESEPVKLEADKTYSIRVEYFESDGDAQVRLQWSAPSMKRAPLSGRYVAPAPAPK